MLMYKDLNGIEIGEKHGHLILQAICKLVVTFIRS